MLKSTKSSNILTTQIRGLQHLAWHSRASRVFNALARPADFPITSSHVPGNYRLCFTPEVTEHDSERAAPVSQPASKPTLMTALACFSIFTPHLIS